MRRWYDDQVKNKSGMDVLFPKQCSFLFRKYLCTFTSQEHNYDFDTHHAKGGAGSVSECALSGYFFQQNEQILFFYFIRPPDPSALALYQEGRVRNE